MTLSEGVHAASAAAAGSAGESYTVHVALDDPDSVAAAADDDDGGSGITFAPGVPDGELSVPAQRAAGGGIITHCECPSWGRDEHCCKHVLALLFHLAQHRTQGAPQQTLAEGVAASAADVAAGAPPVTAADQPMQGPPAQVQQRPAPQAQPQLSPQPAARRKLPPSLLAPAPLPEPPKGKKGVTAPRADPAAAAGSKQDRAAHGGKSDTALAKRSSHRSKPKHPAAAAAEATQDDPAAPSAAIAGADGGEQAGDEAGEGKPAAVHGRKRQLPAPEVVQDPASNDAAAAPKLRRRKLHAARGILDNVTDPELLDTCRLALASYARAGVVHAAGAAAAGGAAAATSVAAPVAQVEAAAAGLIAATGPEQQSKPNAAAGIQPLDISVAEAAALPLPEDSAGQLQAPASMGQHAVHAASAAAAQPAAAAGGGGAAGAAGVAPAPRKSRMQRLQERLEQQAREDGLLGL